MGMTTTQKILARAAGVEALPRGRAAHVQA